MTTGARLGAFVALLAVLFASAVLAGDAIDPDPVRGAGAHSEATGASAHGMTSPAAVRGLAVAERGYALQLTNNSVPSGETARLRFRIVDSSARPVTNFDLEHERRMHLILVRRDATGFQHLHPQMRPDGTWTMPMRVGLPGSYRVFADFSIDERPITLGADLAVDGRANYRTLPRSEPLARAGDGYTVRLDHDPLSAADEAELLFTVHRSGRVVRTEPYLGAGGHLVALRERDLAFLHTHPGEQDEDGGAEPDEAVAFETTFPSAGRYRLFLQFRSEGEVRTAAFTVEVRP